MTVFVSDIYLLFLKPLLFFLTNFCPKRLIEEPGLYGFFPTSGIIAQIGSTAVSLAAGVYYQSLFCAVDQSGQLPFI
jgi:hypothetical protein